MPEQTGNPLSRRRAFQPLPARRWRNQREPLSCPRRLANSIPGTVRKHPLCGHSAFPGNSPVRPPPFQGSAERVSSRGLCSPHIRSGARRPDGGLGNQLSPRETGASRAGEHQLSVVSPLMRRFCSVSALAVAAGPKVSLFEDVVCFQDVRRQGTAGVHPQGDYAFVTYLGNVRDALVFRNEG